MDWFDVTPPREARRRRIVLLAAMAGPMVLAHYLTPATAHCMLLHDVYRRLLYLPVILAAFWFGWRGGLTCAALIGAAYLPHIYKDWGGEFFTMNLNRTLEVTMYFVVGGITGALTDRLRKTVRALTGKTREVFEAEEQLRRADRLAALGQLTTGLAHEIRNPLGSIRGAAEILGDAETPPAQRAEFGRVLIEETERLDQVLQNFLDYARARKGEARSRARLEPVLDRLLSLLGRKLEAMGIRVERAVADGLPPLAIGEALLQQVLLNLVLNAQQAMTEGGVLRIEAQADGAARQVVIAVADSGPGIPEAARRRIFDPFFTTKPGGTGLGLSIVHQIVTGHGGSVALDADHVPGARLTVTLPMA